MTEEKRLTASLIDFDSAACLAGQKLHKQLEEKPKEATKKVATRKLAVKAAPKPVKTLPAHAKIVRNWKTQDQQLDFELAFDDEGDATVTVFDADQDDEDAAVELCADLSGLDEVIQLLQTVRTNAVRIQSGKLVAEDTAVEEDDDDEEEDDDDEEEEEEGDG